MAFRLKDAGYPQGESGEWYLPERLGGNFVSRCSMSHPYISAVEGAAYAPDVAELLTALPVGYQLQRTEDGFLRHCRRFGAIRWTGITLKAKFMTTPPTHWGNVFYMSIKNQTMSNNKIIPAIEMRITLADLSLALRKLKDHPEKDFLSLMKGWETMTGAEILEKSGIALSEYRNHLGSQHFTFKTPTEHENKGGGILAFYNDGNQPKDKTK